MVVFTPAPLTRRVHVSSHWALPFQLRLDPSPAPQMDSPQMTATLEVDEVGLVLDNVQYAAVFHLLSMLRMATRAERVRGRPSVQS